MLYLIAAVLFASGAGASGANQLWTHASVYGVLCFVFLALGYFVILKEDD